MLEVIIIIIIKKDRLDLLASLYYLIIFHKKKQNYLVVLSCSECCSRSSCPIGELQTSQSIYAWLMKHEFDTCKWKPIKEKQREWERMGVLGSLPGDTSINWASSASWSLFIGILTFLWIVIFLSTLSLGLMLILWLVRNDRTNRRWRRTRRSRRRPLHLQRETKRVRLKFFSLSMNLDINVVVE